jgi:hypothetical protein
VRRLSSLTVGISLLLLVGCGSDDSSQEVLTTTSSITEITTLNDVAANIIGTQLSFSLTEALAESPVAFWFWAPG